MRKVQFFIAGIDEAGRGPLAGPVTAACVVLPADYRNTAITDSKALTPTLREALYEEIKKVALASACVSIGSRRIDLWNIREATAFAMRRTASMVCAKLSSRRYRSHIVYLVDGNMGLGNKFSCEPIVKGDARITAIAAASIVAKVCRDRIMNDLDRRYPGYGLSEHKGYGTELHRTAIKQCGVTKIHRRSFGGVRELFETAGPTQEALFGASDAPPSPERSKRNKRAVVGKGTKSAPASKLREPESGAKAPTKKVLGRSAPEAETESRKVGPPSERVRHTASSDESPSSRTKVEPVYLPVPSLGDEAGLRGENVTTPSEPKPHGASRGRKRTRKVIDQSAPA